MNQSPVSLRTGHIPVAGRYRHTGILQQGNYPYLQTLQPYGSDINAGGRVKIDLRHRLAGNETLSGRTFASGNLSVSEQIRRGYLP